MDAARFGWPVTREESLELLDIFVEELLPRFGDFQDALTEDSWTVYHSRLSFAMNVKMLHPREVIAAVENAWRERPDHASIEQAEGFIRQILGWREYMRGVYLGAHAWVRVHELLSAQQEAAVVVLDRGDGHALLAARHRPNP